MFDHTHYVPILKGKLGEYRSLGSLDEPVKTRLTPLIEPPPIPWDYQEEDFAKTIDQHMGVIGQHIEDSWDAERPLFVDLRLIPDDSRMANGEHPMSFVLADARARGLKVIPVTGPRRAPNYQAAVKAAVVTDRRGVCARLEGEDLEDPATALRLLLRQTQVASEDVDLLIDLGAIATVQTGTLSVALISILNSVPEVKAIRTLTVAATGFPENLADIPGNSIETIERAEWVLWRKLLERRGKIPRLPTFGDYAIQHPEVTEVDPRIMRMSANLRYTIDGAWLILKGRNVRDHGYEQFADLCMALIRREDYRGAAFSWGDTYIEACARGETTSGNATTWRQIGTTHHLTFVVRQIANLPGL